MGMLVQIIFFLGGGGDFWMPDIMSALQIWENNLGFQILIN